VTPSVGWKTGQCPLDDSKRLCVYTLEKAIKKLPEDGETILGIFDLRGFTAKNGDWNFIRFLVRLCSTAYTAVLEVIRDKSHCSGIALAFK
jgi:hypothetical protein